MRSRPGGPLGPALMLLLLLAGPVREAAAQRLSDAAITRDLDAYVRKGMKDWEVPGLSIAVVRRDSIVLLKGYGVLERGGSAAVDQHTLFGMMSTTKAMTALSIAMLVDDGVLHWDDPVTRWVPEFAMPEPYVTATLRVEDLLTHNAGLGNADLLWTRHDLSGAEILRRIRLLRPEYPLRGGFIYQNIMYGLAGEVIARASGVSYAEFLRRRIFAPLGMTRSYPTYSAMLASGDPNRSRPHYRIRDTVRVIEDEAIDELPAAGAVWSTASDMATWMRFLLDSARVNGRRLVSDSSYQRIFAPHVMIGPEEFYSTARLTQPRWTTYGLGWFQQDYRGHYVAFHTGSLDGRTAIVGLLPEERAGIYVFGNLDHAELRHALMLRALDLFLGESPRDWNAELLRMQRASRARADSSRTRMARSRVHGTRPSHPLADYAGTYVHPVFGDAVVELAGDRLMFQMGNNPMLRGPLSHWHYDTFQAALGDGRDSPTMMRFGLATDGHVAELRVSGVEGAFARGMR